MTTNASLSDSTLLTQRMIDIAKGRAWSNLDMPVHRVTSALKAGVNANVAFELGQYIPIDVLCHTLSLSKRTLRLKANASVTLSSKQSDMLLHLVRTWSKLLNFVDNDRELMLTWLDKEVCDLDVAKPRLLLDSIYGRKVLLKLVDKLRFDEIAV